jgi:hypothetical protein
VKAGLSPTAAAKQLGLGRSTVYREVNRAGIERYPAGARSLETAVGFDHVTIGVSDLERSKVFYDKALKAIGIERLHRNRHYGRTGFQQRSVRQDIGQHRGHPVR